MGVSQSQNGGTSGPWGYTGATRRLWVTLFIDVLLSRTCCEAPRFDGTFSSPCQKEPSHSLANFSLGFPQNILVLTDFHSALRVRLGTYFS